MSTQFALVENINYFSKNIEVDFEVEVEFGIVVYIE
jgi:hypothetical protein